MGTPEPEQLNLHCRRFSIATGEAEVVMAGQLIATVGSDDVVGERGLLLGAPRAATVTAVRVVAARLFKVPSGGPISLTSALTLGSLPPTLRDEP